MKKMLLGLCILGAAGGIAGAAPTQVSTGFNDTCKIDAGALSCWGDNSYGQMGQGSTGADRLTPIAIPGMTTGVTQVSVAGDDGTICAVKSGAAYCWGHNDHGQIGDTTVTDRYAPTAVSTSIMTGTVTKVVTGGHTTCAISGSNSTLYCWGSGQQGQLNDAIGVDFYAPRTEPPTIPKTVDVSVNNGTVCYIRHFDPGDVGAGIVADNLLICLGNNSKGQVGYDPVANPIIDPSGAPIMYGFDGFTSRVANPIKVSVGFDHMCTLGDDGHIYCFGNNANGELGDGFLVNKFNPPATAGGSGYTDVSAGGTHSCGLTATGGNCWGGGIHGQLDSYPVVTRATPATLPAVHLPATSITTGFATTCFIHSSTIVCVGANESGELGDGSQNDGWDPYTGPSLPAMKSSTGLGHTCIIGQTTGGLFCWGTNSHGELGQGATSAPSNAANPVPGMDSDIQYVSASMDGQTTCAIKDGALYCWGKNDVGQVGDGTSGTDRTSPTYIMDAYWVSTAGNHTCALGGGAFGANHGLGLYCWGSNANGQLGLGAGAGTGNFTSPQLVPGLDYRMVDVSANTSFTCALQQPENGQPNKLYCFGLNTYGQLGNGGVGSTNAPGNALTITSPLRVSAGWGHACARGGASGSTVYCWGNNANGEIGDNTLTNRTAPTAVAPTSLATTLAATEISAGGDHTCATEWSPITGSAKSFCWGWNGHCQLGSHCGVSYQCVPHFGCSYVITTVDEHVPTAVSTVTPFSDVSAGGYSSFSFLHFTAGISPMMWGDNANGQLGNGTFAPAGTPTLVSTPAFGW